ncbi:MAG: hypothetical protein IPH62_19300 [Ignavibacteriae bacterium]|nr:hypothetical protein [Ignavibacteriota bacterium]
MKKLIFILLLVMLSLFGCKGNDDNPTESNTEKEVLFPLNVGNQWEYQRTSFDSIGNIRNVSTIVCRVESDTTILNEKWYKTFWGFEMNKDDGLWQYYDSSSNVNGIGYSTLQYVYPSSANYSYRPMGANGTITVVSINESFTTPSQTFQCYHYRLKYDNTNGYQQDYYFSPNIGYIKWEEGIKSLSGKWYTSSKYELISYEVE